MEYNYLGRITQPRSLVTVYVFKPSPPGSGKPVVSLRPCIYINGKRLKSGRPTDYNISGRFEAVRIHQTGQKFDFARIMKNVNSNTLDCNKILVKSRLLHNSVYHGVFIDYDYGTSQYKLAVGPQILNVPAEFLSNCDNVCPERLSDSIVCMRFKVLGGAESQPGTLAVGDRHTSISPANSSVLASLIGASSEATCQPCVGPLSIKSQQITPDGSSPLKPTTNLSSESLQPCSLDLQEHLGVEELTEQDFLHLSPILSRSQIIADRFRITVTI